MGRKKAQCKDFPLQLQKARKKNGLTQEKLAEKMDVEARTVNSWEQRTESLTGGGKSWREPALSEVVKLATLLHVTTDNLLGKDDNENRPMRNAASEIGVSQIAAKKLAEYASSRPEQRNLPLNGLICDPYFESLLNDLMVLKLAVDNLYIDPLAHDRVVEDKVMEKTLTGFAYVDYSRELLVRSFDHIVRRITRFDEAADAHNRAINDRATRKLQEAVEATKGDE